MAILPTPALSRAELRAHPHIRTSTRFCDVGGGGGVDLNHGAGPLVYSLPRWSTAYRQKVDAEHSSGRRFRFWHLVCLTGHQGKAFFPCCFAKAWGMEQADVGVQT